MGDMNFPSSPVIGEDFLGWSWDGDKWVLNNTASGPTVVTTADVQLTNPQRADLKNQEDANNYFYEAIQDGVGGDGGDVDLTNYYTKPESDGKFQVKGNYLITEEDPTVPAHVKAITTTDINNWNNPPTGGDGGGGGAVLSVNGKTGNVNLNYSDVGAQVAGSYAASSHTHSYAPIGASYTKAESDNKYQPKGSSGAWDGNFTGAFATFNTTDQYAGLRVKGPNAALRLQVKGGDGKHIRCSGNRLDILSDSYATNLFNVGDDSVCNAKDFVASSDRNLKHDIETAPTGVIEKLRGVTFKWNEDGKESSGVIAQEVQDAGLGHLVRTNEGTGYLSVSYAGLTGYLIEEIKALKAEIEAMKR